MLGIQDLQFCVLMFLAELETSEEIRGGVFLCMRVIACFVDGGLFVPCMKVRLCRFGYLKFTQLTICNRETRQIGCLEFISYVGAKKMGILSYFRGLARVRLMSDSDLMEKGRFVTKTHNLSFLNNETAFHFVIFYKIVCFRFVLMIGVCTVVN